METATIFEKIPAKLRSRVALVDGVLHVSAEVREEPEVRECYSHLYHSWGAIKYKFHPPEEFDRQYANQSARTGQGENDVVQYGMDLLAKAYEANASDIHIIDSGPYTMIRFRILGMLANYTHLEGPYGRQVIACLYQKMGQSGVTSFSPSKRQEGRIAKREYLPGPVHSVRVHCEPIEITQGQNTVGTSMTLRLLYDSTSAKGSLSERMLRLGFTPEHCETMQFLTRRTGLTIISGPTVHGKSTLLKHVMEAMVERTPEKAFFSVEDPPEYPLQGVCQVLIGTVEDEDKLAQAYKDAIAGAMRSDPDVLMIGEIRYVAAALAAIDAALTGHGVWATLHANNAFGIIARLVSILSEKSVNALELLCDPNVLAGLAYQRLLPVLCPDCKVRMLDMKPEELVRYVPRDVQQRLDKVLPDQGGVYVRSKGCEKCRDLGLVSQTVAAEVIALDQRMLGHLREGKIADAYDYWLKEKRGKSYVQHALDLIRQGMVDPYLAEERLGVPLDFNQIFMEGRP